jgi:DNA gyrase/topoisomerase IV subunit A
MKAFDLNEHQAKAVLALQLRRLGKLALTEVKQEIASLREQLKQLKLDAKNPQMRAAEDLEARAKAYMKNPDEKIQRHMLD